ncbi:MAG: sugar kinase [Pseudomonadota bacterium]
MTQKDPIRIAAIGEAMVELSGANPKAGTLRMGFAGDTLNTAIYLARAMPNAEVFYVTQLGRDGFSNAMIAEMEAEGLRTDLVGRHPERLPGLYAIELDREGERSFRYWRSEAAARLLFSDGPPGLDALDGMDVLYLSAITLAILPPDIRARLTRKLADLRDGGKTVVFDSNYRPRLWADADTARTSIDAMWRSTSIALPSYDDEAILHPGLAPSQVRDRIATFGVPEIVLKNGPAGPLLWAGAPVEAGPFAAAERVVDTTAAGDSFNAGYLAARLAGAAPSEAAQAGHALACKVIAAPGAILPRDR